MDKINVGIIGFGAAGRVFHAPIILSIKQFRLSKVMARRTEQRATVPEGVQIVDSADEIIKDPEIDLVVIATPNESHYTLAANALSNGKNVVVEKPFTVTSEEALSLLNLAEEKERVLSVHHNRRFDSDFLTIRKLLSDKKLGRILRYEAHYDRFRLNIKQGWRESDIPGAGLLYDLGSHLIDQALALFGTPSAVTCFLRRERPGAIADDAFDLVLEYDDLNVTLHSTMLARNDGPRYVIHGDKASFVKYGIDPQEEILKAGNKPSDFAVWGREDDSMYGDFIDNNLVREKIVSECGDYRQYYSNIYHSIMEKTEPAVTAKDGFNVIKIIELAGESARTRKTIHL